jgi:RNA polymerase sigma-70 factor (ECF subfamily)
MSESDINILANKIKKGNMIAYSVLFKKYYMQLCVCANEIIGDFEQSRDLVQEVFYKLWDGKAQLPYFSNFENYIYRAVKNKAFDYNRHKIHKGLYESYIQANYNNEYSQQDEIEISELKKLISDTVNSLPIKTKEVYNLFKVQNKKQKEIAEYLDLSLKSVEYHMKKVKDEIVKTIEEYYC